jgi:predicted dienelactone hydrolase
MIVRLFSLLMVAQFLLGGCAAAQQYDPLAAVVQTAPTILDLDIRDETRARIIPIRIYLPAVSAATPVVLFSHGLGGSRETNAYLGLHWAARGYVVVFVQHPGSDESVWKDKRPLQRMAAMRRAANTENFLARVKDVPAVVDQLQQWNKPGNHPLAGRLDLNKIGMSGHSFGAITTQALSGQRFDAGRVSFTDARIKAAVMFSPSSPRRGGDPNLAFGQVSIPWMLMTGTKDVAPIGDADVASRLAVFPALPPDHKYEVVLDGAEHSAFTDRALPGDTDSRNPNHHRVILALSTAFWDAYLLDSEAAKAWLRGEGPRSILESKDRWQWK